MASSPNSVRNGFSVRFAAGACLVAAILGGCRERPPSPPEDAASRAPASVKFEGAAWTRSDDVSANETRLTKLFRERSDLADGGYVTGDLVVYASPDRSRFRFVWIEASPRGDAWVWVETDATGAFRASGDGFADRFPGSG